MNMKKERWLCEKCGVVLVGHFDGNVLTDAVINNQKIEIEDFGYARLSAICKKCGHKNIWDGKRFLQEEQYWVENQDYIHRKDMHRRGVDT